MNLFGRFTLSGLPAGSPPGGVGAVDGRGRGSWAAAAAGWQGVAASRRDQVVTATVAVRTCKCIKQRKDKKLLKNANMYMLFFLK